MKKKICIVTGSRAEYFLLKNLISEISKSKKVEFSVAVTGQNLSKSFGYLAKQIRKDFKNKCKFLSINVKKSTPRNISKSISIGIDKFSKFFDKYNYDLLIILGDRYEILPAVFAATFNDIKIAHIHGGEKTIDSLDDSLRHVITKLSHLHFVTNVSYKKRIIQLGENPNNIFDVGSLGVENIHKTKFIPKKKLEKLLNLKFDKKFFLVTINSFLENEISIDNFLRKFTTELKKIKNTTIIFTLPNSDIKSDKIKRKIISICKAYKNFYFFNYLGGNTYLSCMKIADIVIGNSSSGIIETPSLKTSTINIGRRQEGRIMSKNIVNIESSCKNFYSTINYINSKKFKLRKKNLKNPFYKKGTSKTILRIILKQLSKSIKSKIFHDIKF